MSRRYPIVFPRYMRPKDGVIKAELRAGVPWCPKHKQAAPLHHGLPHCRSCEIARIWDRALERVTTERDTLREDVDFFERGHFRAGSLAKVEQERDKARAEIAAISEAIADYACKDEMPVQTCRILMDDLERARRERDQASSALEGAQEDLREARDEMESAIERSRSAEHNLKDVRDHAHAAGKREGVEAAHKIADGEYEDARDSGAGGPNPNWFSGQAVAGRIRTAIHSLLSEPACTFCVGGVVNAVEGGTAPCPKCSESEPEDSQDAAPATASPEPHHWRYEVPGLSGKFRCKVCGLLSDKPLIEPCHATKIGGDSLVARLRDWLHLIDARNDKPNGDDTRLRALLTMAADALEGAEVQNSALKASEPDTPEAGGNLVRRLRFLQLQAETWATTGGYPEMRAILKEIAPVLTQAADALEGAKEREHQAAIEERAACIAELRRAEQAERNIGAHQRAEGFHGAANMLGNVRLAWDLAQDNAIRARAKKGE